MTEPINGGGDVRFTVKEMFTTIGQQYEALDKKLDAVDRKLDGKADKAELVTFNARLHGVETWRAEILAQDPYYRRLIEEFRSGQSAALSFDKRLQAVEDGLKSRAVYQMDSRAWIAIGVSAALAVLNIITLVGRVHV